MTYDEKIICTVPGMSGYRRWHTFFCRGRKFLALERYDGTVHILDFQMRNYGSFGSCKIFRDLYKRGDSVAEPLDEGVTTND